MDRIDKLIADALSDEDRELLESMEEPGFFALGLGQFRGKLGWVTWVLMLVQTVMFFAAVWCGWQFYTATELMLALKWGLTAAVLAIIATQLKMALMPQMQADRVLRALRRLELMIVQSRSQG